jgi:hypothetical protein
VPCEGIKVDAIHVSQLSVEGDSGGPIFCGPRHECMGEARYMNINYI